MLCLVFAESLDNPAKQGNARDALRLIAVLRSEVAIGPLVHDLTWQPKPVPDAKLPFRERYPCVDTLIDLSSARTLRYLRRRVAETDNDLVHRCAGAVVRGTMGEKWGPIYVETVRDHEADPVKKARLERWRVHTGQEQR